jgi:hypothetical protein
VQGVWIILNHQERESSVQHNLTLTTQIGSKLSYHLSIAKERATISIPLNFSFPAMDPERRIFH